MRIVRSFLILTLVLSMSLSAVPPQSGGLLADFEKSVTEFTLANGMKFIIVERHQVPVVAFNLYVDVGGVDEISGMTGVSHLFEHMAFKGTTTIGAKDYPAEKRLMEIQDKAYLALQT